MDPNRAKNVLLNGEHEDEVVNYLLDLIDRDLGMVPELDSISLPPKYTTTETKYLYTYKCTSCGLMLTNLRNFCPGCGFKINSKKLD